MSPVTILLVGIAIVIGGILVLRLHAFFVLVLAALVIAAMTPRAWVARHETVPRRVRLVSVDEPAGFAVLGVNEESGAYRGLRFLALRPDSASGQLMQVARLSVDRFESRPDGDGLEVSCAIASVTLENSVESLRVSDVVISPRDWQAAQQVAAQTIGERVASGFGNTCTKIGILIAMAAIIGKCLLDSGAADRIVRSAIHRCGQRGVPVAFLGSGFLLGIPVFFDTVFYLMIPLGKAMGMRSGRNYLLYVLTVFAGATMAHSLVPPTPGPLFVAEALHIDLGLMILGGCIVGSFTVTVGYFWAQLANRIWELPLRETPDMSLKDLEATSRQDEDALPPLWLSLLPILLPVVLIGGLTVAEPLKNDVNARVWNVLNTLGNKNIALVISAGISMATLVWKKRIRFNELGASMQGALASGGVIILITAAGGAFGTVIQQTGIANVIDRLPQGSPLLVLPLAFLVTAAVRTAQGSATVSMITAVGIVSGIASAEQLGFHPVYLALAIGCGSKPLAWMNDSGFWVICKMSGMTEGEGLKFITPMGAVMAVVGLAVTILGARFMPLS